MANLNWSKHGLQRECSDIQIKSIHSRGTSIDISTWFNSLHCLIYVGLSAVLKINDGLSVSVLIYDGLSVSVLIYDGRPVSLHTLRSISSSSLCNSVSFSVCWWCIKRLRTASSSCSSRRWISRFIACNLINSARETFSGVCYSGIHLVLLHYAGWLV